MKIEIAEPGRMTQSGSSLLKLIQNNNMPILDLLVRESIQNSLDAKNDKDPYVTVEFLTGEFNKLKLNKELEGITDSINKKYWKDTYKFIAIKDSNTVGLTGKLHYDDVIDNQYGNLLKLIYEISKAQEAEGAGGSWGLGKTVYFRVGMGLVIYYSRIINEDGSYESRLAASLVENELQNDSLIPIWKEKAKRGIAWWGEEIKENDTRPIVDEQYIEKILSIFNIKPYEGEETGTTIIIPYINEEKLLQSNQIGYCNEEEKRIQLFWQSSVEEYLKIAVQRWYAPRLNNLKYPYGKYLRVRINGNGISSDEMEPTFKVVQALYNRAVSSDKGSDILDMSSIITKEEDIKIRKVLDVTKAGTIVYTKVSRELLQMNYPNNRPTPYMYFNCDIKDKEKNKPILFFTRKPGMIVSYENIGHWVDGINSTNKEEFIMAIFVLNSTNKLVGTNEEYTLEEYVRKSEMADHTSWGDFSIGNFNPRIVSKIQGQINSKISKEFSAEEEDNISKLNSGLGKMFGDLLLPPENFGNKPSNGNSGISSTDIYSEKHKSIIFGIDKRNIQYSSLEMSVKAHIKSKEKITSTGVIMGIDSEVGTITAENWENKMGLNMPFEITNCIIEVVKLDGSECKIEMKLGDGILEVKEGYISVSLLRTENKMGYGVHVDVEGEHSIELYLTLVLRLYRKDISPLFMVEKNEGDK